MAGREGERPPATQRQPLRSPLAETEPPFAILPSLPPSQGRPVQTSQAREPEESDSLGEVGNRAEATTSQPTRKRLRAAASEVPLRTLEKARARPPARPSPALGPPYLRGRQRLEGRAPRAGGLAGRNSRGGGGGGAPPWALLRPPVPLSWASAAGRRGASSHRKARLHLPRLAKGGDLAPLSLLAGGWRSTSGRFGAGGEGRGEGKSGGSRNEKSPPSQVLGRFLAPAEASAGQRSPPARAPWRFPAVPPLPPALPARKTRSPPHPHPGKPRQPGAPRRETRGCLFH